jgi:hypothetical protein
MSVTSISREKRIFTLQEAKAIIPVVRKITSNAATRVDELIRNLESLSEDDPEFEETRGAVDTVVREWADKVQKLGGEVKGIWLVDLDNGQGYYCWKFPEEEIDHFHSYDTGFSSRTRIC